jgi:hypothetical protein
LHPRALPEPDVSLSTHPAPVIPWPYGAIPSCQRVSKKVELDVGVVFSPKAVPAIHESCLVRMRFQLASQQACFHRGFDCFGVRLGPAVDHDIVCLCSTTGSKVPCLSLFRVLAASRPDAATAACRFTPLLVPD